MAYDELELDRIGDRKTAVFFIISDTTQTYNFLVALAFSQMFNLLCERADNVHGGRLPHHVRVLWDEAANTGQVPQLEKLVAVIRSREVSLCLLYQQIAVLQALGLPAFDTLHAALPFLGGLAPFLGLPLTLADTAGHEVARFPKAWHNGLPLAAAFLTVDETV
jgi:hypothetical protein